MKGYWPQFWSAVFVGVSLFACIALTATFAELHLSCPWLVLPPLLLAVRVGLFPRLEKLPSKKSTPTDLKAILAERDYIETVLNTRVNFLLTASAILGAAATQLAEHRQATFAYGLGACISGLTILGIDRSCAKLNFYLNILHEEKLPTFKRFDDEKTKWTFGGLFGSVYICTYSLAVFIFLAFLFLSSH